MSYRVMYEANNYEYTASTQVHATREAAQVECDSYGEPETYWVAEGPTEQDRKDAVRSQAFNMSNHC